MVIVDMDIEEDMLKRSSQGINTDRYDVLEQLADKILSISCRHPLRVAVDGIDAAGKTFLADELVIPLEKSGRQVIRTSVDGFHNPKEIRYRLGENSPEGYYRDSFNYEAVVNTLLKPLGPDGDRYYFRSVFDYRKEKPVDAPKELASSDSILVFDGIFLLRPELIKYWDFSIFVYVDFSTAITRGIRRYFDVSIHPSDEDSIRRKYVARYIPGQQIYLKESEPRQRADLILDNNNFEHPKIILN